MGTAPPAGTTGLTYDDWLDLPEPSDAGVRYELLDGELLVSPTPRIRHQDSVLALVMALHGHLAPRGGKALPAPVAVVLSEATVLEPDVVAVTAARMDGFDEMRYVGAPDLVIEVSSPSSRRTDVLRKRRAYEQAGVPEFWFVDLDADQVHRYVLGQDGAYGPPTVVLDDGELVSAALAGFTMTAATALALGR